MFLSTAKQIIRDVSQFVRVPQSAASVYLALAEHSKNGDNSCFPAVHTIAANANIASENTARTAFKKLQSLGLLHYERRYRNNGGNSSNLYVLLDPRDDYNAKFKVLFAQTEIVENDLNVLETPMTEVISVSVSTQESDAKITANTTAKSNFPQRDCAENHKHIVPNCSTLPQFLSDNVNFPPVTSMTDGIDDCSRALGNLNATEDNSTETSICTKKKSENNSKTPKLQSKERDELAQIITKLELNSFLGQTATAVKEAVTQLFCRDKLTVNGAVLPQELVRKSLRSLSPTIVEDALERVRTKPKNPIKNYALYFQTTLFNSICEFSLDCYETDILQRDILNNPRFREHRDTILRARNQHQAQHK